jgi:hypothetical protein
VPRQVQPVLQSILQAALHRQARPVLECTLLAALHRQAQPVLQSTLQAASHRQAQPVLQSILQAASHRQAQPLLQSILPAALHPQACQALLPFRQARLPHRHRLVSRSTLQLVYRHQHPLQRQQLRFLVQSPMAQPTLIPTTVRIIQSPVESIILAVISA